MSAAQIPGTPVAAPAAPPAAVEAPATAEAPVVESGGDSGEGDVDEAAVRRREARKILFDAEEPTEESGEGEPESKKPEATEPEKPKEPEPETKKPEARSEDEIALSKEWAKFRRDRKAFEADAKKFKAEREAFDASKTKLEAQLAKLNDPVAFLAEAGWGKDRIVEFIQSDGKVDPEILIKQLGDKHQRELEELRSERKREQEALEFEKNQRKLETLRSQLDAEVATLVDSGDSYPLLKRYVAKKGVASIQTRVRDTIAAVWNKKQEVVAPDDALAYFEAELAEIQLGDAPGQLPAVQSAKAAAVEPKPITNQATSQRVVVPSQYDETDPEQRRRRAKAILDGEIEE